MRIFLFILCFFSFIFLFAFLVWKFDVLFVRLLVVVFLYGHSKQARSLFLLVYIIVHGVQPVTLIIGFIHCQRIFFTLCDSRSEGAVPANTLKRLEKRKI